VILGGALALLLLAGCGGGEEAKKNEIAALEKQVNEGLKQQERLFGLKGEVAALRRQLKSMASDPLRSSLEELQQRLASTGTSLGLQVRRLQPEGTMDLDGPTDVEVFRLRLRGKPENLERWLRDVVTWEVALYPTAIETVKEDRGGERHDLTFSRPVWSLPPEAPDPAQPPPPGPEPEDFTESRIWRLQQNLAQTEEARKVMPATQEEMDRLAAIPTDIELWKKRSTALIAALTDALAAVDRMGALEALSADLANTKITAVVLNQGVEADLVDALSQSTNLRNVAAASRQQTRIGLRVIIDAEVAQPQ